MNTTRLLAALLAVSLAGHAVFLLHASRSNPSSSAVNPSLKKSASATTRSPFGRGDYSSQTAVELSRALSAGTLADFRELLEAAGVEPKLRRELLQVALQHRYQSRYQALDLDFHERMLREWWRNPTTDDDLPPAEIRRRQEESLALSKSFNAELASLVGDPAELLDGSDDIWLARRFSGLPPEKAKALRRIELDYQELEHEIHARAGSFLLPSDQEKLRLLKEEQERDIDALLTPKDRVEWELRASSTAHTARDYATRYKASEEEYRRIFALQKTFDEAFEFDPFTPATGSQVDWNARAEAQKALDDGIRAIVGDERYLAAQREHDQDFTLARAAVERLGLPPEIAERLGALRSPAAAESRRIAADPKLNPEEKKASLARLAADSRAELERSLGPEAAAVYLERGGMGWLKTLESGSAVDHADSADPDTGTPAPPLISID